MTLALVGPLESAGEKELREERESREMFEQIRKAIAGNEEKQLKFTEIIDFVIVILELSPRIIRIVEM